MPNHKVLIEDHLVNVCGFCLGSLQLGGQSLNPIVVGF
jgi:hypothetical protein